MKYTELPVYKHKDLILKALREHQVVVVESPTGSGKTTQLPVILLDADFAKNGMIGVTQPRRIAALSISEFIARQLGTSFPGLVGYKMRFADLTSPSTKIKIMTDGILLQEMKLDPRLSKYDCIVVDEAHERSLTIDFILGLLKRVLEVRRDFKVIVSSATINAESFSEYFGECPIVRIDAAAYPVTLIYDPPPAASSKVTAPELLLDKISSIVERFIGEKRQGDILVFLPGEKLIKDCITRLASLPSGKRLQLIPLYGRLSKEEQEHVFEKAPWGKIKVVVATNIAETSVTIDGVSAVIDSGLSKLNFYNQYSFTSSLVEGPISKASANQRKGRAGRTREGSCYRLYTRRDFESRPLFTMEEIYRTDLSEVVLRMADLGITNFEEFNFISPPEHDGLISAVETLNLLGALEPDNTLSDIGKMMTEFPLSPRQSRIIVEAILKYPNVVCETIIAAAFLSTSSPYLLPSGEETDARHKHHTFRDNKGDFVSYLKLFSAYKNAGNKSEFCGKYYLEERAMAEIANVVDQLETIVSDLGVPLISGGAADDYLCAVARGLIQFVCVREGREIYRSLTADKILIHPGSVMFKMDPQYIVAGEIIRTARMYASSVSPLSKANLEKIGGGLLSRFSGGVEKRERRKTPEIVRDWTNNIKIGDELFEVKTVKGRKIVRLEWNRFSKVLGSAGNVFFKGLRGVIILKNGYTVLEGEKTSLITTIAPALDIDGALSRKLPGHREFRSGQDLDALINVLPLILLPARRKKGAKELGFIYLMSNGEGSYRLHLSRKFHTALNESVSSIENLIDDLKDDVDLDKKHLVNAAYRRLSNYLS
ncbi:MAG: ATP-dependent RNA helicase [Spirochaetaceae bacterium]|jgi:HrpA-like RNA helicase|nr:ATP-dependent RNA helicase [Spirochaetaceae bacterium]